MLHQDLKLLPAPLTCLTSDSQRTPRELQNKRHTLWKQRRCHATTFWGNKLFSWPAQRENKACRAALFCHESSFHTPCPPSPHFLFCLYLTDFHSWWLPWVCSPKFPLLLQVFNSLPWQGRGGVDVASHGAWKEASVQNKSVARLGRTTRKWQAARRCVQLGAKFEFKNKKFLVKSNNFAMDV